MKKNMDFNSQMRAKIASDINTIVNNGHLQLSFAISIYARYLKSKVSTSLMEKIYIKYLYAILYLDAYKMYSYYHKRGLNNDEYSYLYEQIVDIDDLDTLERKININFDFLCFLLESSYNFINMDALGKILSVYDLSEKENKELVTFSSMHELDLEHYKKTITCEHLISWFKSQTEFYQKRFQKDLLEAQFVEFAGFLREFCLKNKSNGIELLSEIAKTNYQVIKHFHYEIDIEEILFYENSSFAEIIERMIDDQDFLYNTFCTFIDRNVFNTYLDMPIEDDINLLEDSQVIKKLTMKNNEESINL